ncbi:MAG: hypothetical protein J6V41_04190 [Kiritimatiellae bacterium]|nr:hypothetical protein [Kiritimatiellia bacterium]
MKNNGKVVLSLIIAFVLSAYLQDRLPSFTVYAIKIPFIIAAFVYFAFRHNWIIGIIATALSAVFGDGLSLSCGIAYLIVCSLTTILIYFFLKKQLVENSISCGLIALPLTLVLLLIQYFCIVVYEGVSLPFYFLLTKLLLTAVITAIVTVVLSELFYRFEIIVGNKEVVNEELG